MISLACLTGELLKGAGPRSRVLFRVDAGRERGLSFGHLFRCHELSKAMRQRHGLATAFVMRPLEEGTAQARRMGETVVELGSKACGETLANSDALVLDLPYAPEQNLLDWHAAQRPWTIFIDDTGRDVLPADVVLNSSVLAQAQSYPRGERHLLGPEHLILDERFEALRRKRQTWTEKPKRPVVLVTFGGSDPTGLTVKLLQALAHNGSTGCEFKVILGPGFANQEIVQRICQDVADPVEVVQSPEDILPWYGAADAAVCAGGRTMYELWALGIPTVAVASIGHEAEAIAACVDKGMLAAGFAAWDQQHFLAALAAITA